MFDIWLLYSPILLEAYGSAPETISNPGTILLKIFRKEGARLPLFLSTVMEYLPDCYGNPSFCIVFLSKKYEVQNPSFNFAGPEK